MFKSKRTWIVSSGYNKKKLFLQIYSCPYVFHGGPIFSKIQVYCNICITNLILFSVQVVFVEVHLRKLTEQVNF